MYDATSNAAVPYAKRDKERLRPLSFRDIAVHFEKPLSEAATLLGRSSSKLKQELRALNIPRWPFRKINSLRERMRVLELKDEQFKEKHDQGTTTKKSPFAMQIEALENQIHELKNNPSAVMGNGTAKKKKKQQDDDVEDNDAQDLDGEDEDEPMEQLATRPLPALIATTTTSVKNASKPKSHIPIVIPTATKIKHTQIAAAYHMASNMHSQPYKPAATSTITTTTFAPQPIGSKNHDQVTLYGSNQSAIQQLFQSSSNNRAPNPSNHHVQPQIEFTLPPLKNLVDMETDSTKEVLPSPSVSTTVARKRPNPLAIDSLGEA